MLKKIIALCLALACCLSTALAWSCPGCCSDNSGKFCTECGTKKPENICPSCGTDFGDALPKFCTECGTKLGAAAAAIPVPTAAPTATPAPTEVPQPTTAPVTFGTFDTNADGTLTINWTGGVAPYKIQYMAARSEDFFEDRAAGRSDGSYWTVGDSVEETTYTFTRLVPGEPYWIVVLDAEENGRYVLHTPPAAEKFDAFDIRLDVIPRSQVGETRTDIDCIPADIAGLEDETEHGAYIYLNYTNNGSPREALYQLAFVLPDGTMRVDTVTTVTLVSGENKWLGWNFYNLEWYLNRLREYRDTLPEGDIIVRAYLDGQLAGEGVLPFKSLKAVNISAVMDQGNGKHVITWVDNGNGPYDVHYWEKFSQDMETDRYDDRSSGRWSDIKDLAATTHTLEYLIPGTSYWITVTDSTGSVGVTTYTVPEAQDVELGVSFSGSFRKRVNGEVSDLEAFSSAVMSQDDEAQYGLYLEMNYNTVAADKDLPSQWVMTLPDGVAFCFDAFDLTWFAGDGCHWDFFNLDWPFGRVKAWYGKMLTGEYAVDFYSEGEYAGGFTFNVTE